MHNSFISIVTVINADYEIRLLPDYLNAVNAQLKANFSDYEIILVNNSVSTTEIYQCIEQLPAEQKHNIYQLNLSTTANKNHAVVAGFDRANGDYTILFELAFADKTEYILDLFQKSQEGHDIVYLKANRRSTKVRFKLFYQVFYFILKRYSTLKIDELAHNTRLISRRALNSIVRMRENLKYMKAIYSLVGYSTSYVEVPEALVSDDNTSFGEHFRTSLVAITSFTTFLRSIMLWIFLGSLGFLGLVIYNAFKVKMYSIDIFGNTQESVTGWAFLVVIISIFFAITCLNLYIMSIYMSNIYQEIKKRPLYIIESVKRF